MLSIKISSNNRHVVDAVIGLDTAHEWQKSNLQGVSVSMSSLNPFLLACMLCACAQGTVEDLLCLKLTQDRVQIRGTGVLGKVHGYLASVASGGAGTVMLNVVVWLMNTPSVSCMHLETPLVHILLW